MPSQGSCNTNYDSDKVAAEPSRASLFHRVFYCNETIINCLALRSLVVEVRSDSRTKFIPLHWLILLHRVRLKAYPLFDNGFDLLELDGRDLRREPIEKRKDLLAKLLRGSHLSIVLNEHFEDDGAAVYRAACQLGCEGIVSKRLGSPYRSGRSPHWVKVKNPKAPAVSREAEEKWG